jgi:hypothetical protein
MVHVKPAGRVEREHEPALASFKQRLNSVEIALHGVETRLNGIKRALNGVETALPYR